MSSPHRKISKEDEEKHGDIPIISLDDGFMQLEKGLRCHAVASRLLISGHEAVICECDDGGECILL